MGKSLRSWRDIALRIAPGVISLGLAAYMARPVWHLAHYKDEQVIDYDAAIQIAASQSDPKASAVVFAALQQSIEAFNSAQTYTWWERLNLPIPDQEQVALAWFHIGNILAATRPEEALGAYVESLRLNSGQTMLPGVYGRDDPAHQYGRDFCVSPEDKLAMSEPARGDDCQMRRLEKEADDTRNNLRLLVSKHPELKEKLKNLAEIKLPRGMEGSHTAGKESNKKRALPGMTSSPLAGHNDDQRI